MPADNFGRRARAANEAARKLAHASSNVRKTGPLIALAACAALLAGCNITKRVPEGRKLLVRNTITVDEPALNTGDLGAIIKQKPNKRVLGQPVYLMLYNTSDPKKRAARHALKDSLCHEKNIIRERKGKKLKDCDKAHEPLGEPPVLLDSTLMARSTQQLQLYLFKEGWFEGEVHDTTHFKPRRKWPFTGHRKKDWKKPKTEVEYILTPGQPWVICQVNTRVDDPVIAAIVTRSQEDSELEIGDRFDGDAIDKERTRIADLLKDKGYLWFTRDMVLFDADTGVGDHEVDLLMRLERPLSGRQRGLKGTIEGTPQYLSEVVVDITRRGSVNKNIIPDTVRLNNYVFLYRGERPEFKPKALLNSVYLTPYERYSLTDADLTYRRLTALRVFDRVDINYDSTNAGPYRDQVRCRITVLPSPKQSMAIEVFGTNRGGFLGTSLNFNYRHRNLFRSMTSLQASLVLGFEAQQGFDGNAGASDDASTAVGNDVLFNTLELGPELTLRLPRPIILQKLFKRSSAARTNFNVLYNFQRRPDYTRALGKFSFTLFEWQESKYQTFVWNPIEVSLIKIPVISNAFAQFLATTNDAVLTDSYTDHLIAGQRFGFTRNTQQAGHRKRNELFIKAYLETAGNLLRAIHQASDAPEYTDANGNRYYAIEKIRFAQFVKVDADARVYHTIHDKSTVAFRLAAGVGVPLTNLDVLPFETSFFSGGANGLRAWRARSLGPGSYSTATSTFDRIGEMHIDGSVEYRFGIYGYLEGALFADVGNIWSLRPNPAKPGGEFETDDFLNEMAIGTGIGARFNFDFFLVRFDLGFQTKDPSYPTGERWVFEKREVPRTFGSLVNLNLGIGYPF